MITLNGLRELWEKRMSEQDLPEDWENEAKAYLRIKRWAVKNLGGREFDIKQLKEAEMIVRGLYAY